MKNPGLRRIGGLLLLFFMLQAGGVRADALTDRAGTLLDAGKGGEAYRLLEPEESARAGEPLFDFLFGLAALESGQNTRAVFALERVLAMDPGNVRARAEIARAYLALGETETALQEFQTVKRQGVPADVSMTIDRYIASVRRVVSETARSLTAYVELAIGYDTNVNIGPNRNSVLIPSFGNLPFTLGPDSKANQDSFAMLGAGANLRQPLGGGFVLLAGVSANARGNSEKQQFDTYGGDVNLGLSLTADQNVYTLMAQVGTFHVDGNRFRDHSGLTAQWQRNLDARNQISVFGQYTRLNYPDQSVRDADRWVAGAGYAHLFREGMVLYASAYGVQEEPKRDGVGWLAFSGWGARLGGRVNYDAHTVLFGGANYEYRIYDDNDPSFLRKRRDDQFGLMLGATHHFSAQWSVTPQLNLTYNKSNIALSEYHRSLFSVTLRREF
ncbi:MAG: surface lipoprotein assembly modifier [Dechloromonas sp.]|nr:surface lipoprotein assembly modifier [Dechloromonas sp.]